MQDPHLPLGFSLLYFPATLLGLRYLSLSHLLPVVFHYHLIATNISGGVRESLGAGLK
jgi:hypothetical protein